MTTKKPKKKKAESAAPSLLDEINHELDREIGTHDMEGTTTKRQALIAKMFEMALDGDQRMMAQLLKFSGDELASEPAVAEKAGGDWEMLFAFYGKYKKLIEAEIEKRKAQNPGYWAFDWQDATFEMAPWYEDLYGLQ